MPFEQLIALLDKGGVLALAVVLIWQTQRLRSELVGELRAIGDRLRSIEIGRGGRRDAK